MRAQHLLDGVSEPAQNGEVGSRGAIAGLGVDHAERPDAATGRILDGNPGVLPQPRLGDERVVDEARVVGSIRHHHAAIAAHRDRAERLLNRH